ncbi:TPA: 30S ribosomal protein S12 methylthiotransferase RimO [Candidatus Galligastranaerophilus gallistercoris]|nr:30S ribosomal protein S12 methylthiotransferase RimO [Candidatus Galligastranaerophilus gallistercoris]
MKIAIIHHGCAKNLIDTELMAGKLIERGHEVTLDAYATDADYIIVNTCSFIFDAEEESISSIFDMIDTGKRVIITGCLPQKHQKHLKKLISEAWGFIGTADIDKIADLIEADKEFYYVSEKPLCKYPENIKRAQITVGSSSYIKIAEGCNYSCGYCVIPKLRGKYISRPIENIVCEAKELANKGVNEIILIAQDTSCYGMDLYKKPSLDKLLYELDKIKNIGWIRVLYTYPTNFTNGLIKAYKEIDRVVKYIDIPLQHSHPDILKAMRRPVVNGLEFINKLRDEINNLAIRTTLITGYPTEEEKHFEHLYNFVKEAEFDRLGVFEFSKEKGTYAYNLKPQVPKKIKAKRKDLILKLQKEISNKLNEKMIGKKIPSIIETIQSDGLAIARTYKDAPDVDGLIFINTDKVLIPGDIYDVEVTSYSDYDLYGKI